MQPPGGLLQPAETVIVRGPSWRRVRTTLHRAAAGWCLLMAAALTIIQVSPLPGPPLALYLVFTGVWLFGAVMLWVAPVFGAIGTAAYGVILGAQLFAMHGVTLQNGLIALGSFVATGLALTFLRERRKARA